MERGGTLPNSLNGDNDSNRETSDAPLWFSLVVEELGEDCLNIDVGENRSLAEVLISIGQGYRDGTENGVRMDPESGLIWSPSHYTWMDTNYPAGTPREGYPVEIQALWIRLLNQLERLEPNKGWGQLSGQAVTSLYKLYADTECPWISDNLQAESGGMAVKAARDSSLRPNALIAVALGVVEGPLAQRTVLAAKNYLVVPGAIRTLAPLKVELPLEVRDVEGQLLNDPLRPYWGTYQGEEDIRRKPAYHNGTAWGWPFPIFCEALVKAWNGSAEAVEAARSYLLSTEPLMNEGCLGQLPEIIDGDAPHIQRGCDAQAWSVSEALRVWNFLKEYEE
jgi:glycogen debranching enzyme